jgi:hypothetical protein
MKIREMAHQKERINNNFKIIEKKELTRIKFSGILRRSSREMVWMSSGSFFLIFENWSVIKFEAGLNKTLTSLVKGFNWRV